MIDEITRLKAELGAVKHALKLLEADHDACGVIVSEQEADIEALRFQVELLKTQCTADFVSKVHEEEARIWVEEMKTRDARIAQLEAWVDRFEAETRSLPAQHEDESNGASSYNWRMWFVRQIRSAMSDGGES